MLWYQICAILLLISPLYFAVTSLFVCILIRIYNLNTLAYNMPFAQVSQNTTIFRQSYNVFTGTYHIVSMQDGQFSFYSRWMQKHFKKQNNTKFYLCSAQKA